MRKLIGFIGFIFSILWIVVFIISTWDIFVDLFNGLSSNSENINELLSTFLLTYGWLLFLPLISLLLSVIAMGKYS